MRNESILSFILKANKLKFDLPINFRLNLMKQMILAVDSFHTLSKMSHGDLKPDNMVFNELFKVALIDFCHSELIAPRLYH